MAVNPAAAALKQIDLIPILSFPKQFSMTFKEIRIYKYLLLYK